MNEMFTTTKELPNIDGMYLYKWSTRFGRHGIMFNVVGGLIEMWDKNKNAPTRPFNGLPLNSFVFARMKQEWRFDGDELHQMTITKEQKDGKDTNAKRDQREEGKVGSPFSRTSTAPRKVEQRSQHASWGSDRWIQ